MGSVRRLSAKKWVVDQKEPYLEATNVRPSLLKGEYIEVSGESDGEGNEAHTLWVVWRDAIFTENRKVVRGQNILWLGFPFWFLAHLGRLGRQTTNELREFGH